MAGGLDEIDLRRRMRLVALAVALLAALAATVATSARAGSFNSGTGVCVVHTDATRTLFTPNITVRNIWAAPVVARYYLVLVDAESGAALSGWASAGATTLQPGQSNTWSGSLTAPRGLDMARLQVYIGYFANSTTSSPFQGDWSVVTSYDNWAPLSVYMGSLGYVPAGWKDYGLVSSC